MIKLGNIVRGNKRVGYVNSSVMYGEYYATFFGTESSILFKDRSSFQEWLKENNLKVR